jgi:hypothetical protein
MRARLSLSVALAGLTLLLSAAQAADAQPGSSPWRVSPSPNGTTTGVNSLDSVAAVSTTDAWAVGNWRATYEGPLVEHWNGTKWSVVNVPGETRSDYLENVSAPSATNVTITGLYQWGLLILHYNGMSWTRTTPPIPLNAESLGGFGINDVMAPLSATDVWIGIDGGIVDHWNGRGWKGIPTAPATICPDGYFWISAIHPISDSDVWFNTELQCNGLPGGPDHSNLDQWNGSTVIHHGAAGGPAGQSITERRIAAIAVTG